MTEAIRNREELYPTAMDNGVALLHPRRAPCRTSLDRQFWHWVFALGASPLAATTEP